jgi:hypothetical protein
MLRCQQLLTHSRHRYLVLITCAQHKPLRKKDILRSCRRGRYRFASRTFEDYTLSRSSVVLRIHSITDSNRPLYQRVGFLETLQLDESLYCCRSTMELKLPHQTSSGTFTRCFDVRRQTSPLAGSIRRDIIRRSDHLLGVAEYTNSKTLTKSKYHKRQGQQQVLQARQLGKAQQDIEICQHQAGTHRTIRPRTPSSCQPYGARRRMLHHCVAPSSGARNLRYRGGDHQHRLRPRHRYDWAREVEKTEGTCLYLKG